MKPRIFWQLTIAAFCGLLWIPFGGLAQENNEPTSSDPPNVILILSDDQGIGDFGINGNPVVQTPFIDRMARNSASMNRFYVNAVCSPTRASLMTGRWSYRTGVTDTFKGRSIMNFEETTVAEILKEAGYATGLFGKWHLGDVYPYRPMEQGFETAVYHRGGGLGQPSEPAGADARYTNPVLFRNGVQFTAEGYCCDVYFSEAIDFIKASRNDEKPFFVYIASNTPHGPYHDVPEKWLNYYKALDLENSRFPQERGHPIGGNDDLDTRASIYAMVSNLDENVGRLFGALEQMNLVENSLVIYMCDNGPNGNRYVTGFKGRKSNAYEGGIRSPFWAHWPKALNAGTVSDALSAHVDLLPTVLEACGVGLPEGLSVDGRSMLGYLKGEQGEPDDRTVLLQSHRGEKPEIWENATVITQRWKLVNNGKPGNLELFDLSKDPFALDNVISQFPDVRRELEEEYHHWIEQMRDVNPMDLPLFVGSEHEPETVLTNQDLNEIDGKGSDRKGEWRLKVLESGAYLISFSDKAITAPVTADLHIDDERVATLTSHEARERYSFGPVLLKEGMRTLSVTPHHRDNRHLHVFISMRDG